jgi:hypothetical protein
MVVQVTPFPPSARPFISVIKIKMLNVCEAPEAEGQVVGIGDEARQQPSQEMAVLLDRGTAEYGGNVAAQSTRPWCWEPSPLQPPVEDGLLSPGRLDRARVPPGTRAKSASLLRVRTAATFACPSCPS